MASTEGNVVTRDTGNIYFGIVRWTIGGKTGEELA